MKMLRVYAKMEPKMMEPKVSVEDRRV